MRKRIVFSLSLCLVENFFSSAAVGSIRQTKVKGGEEIFTPRKKHDCNAQRNMETTVTHESRTR